MKTLQQLEQEQAEARAKLERELSIASAIVASGMPAPDSVMRTSGESAWVTYKREMLAQGVDILRAARIVPVMLYRGSCTTVSPDCLRTARDIERYSQRAEGGPYACGIDVDEGEGFGPNAVLWFFARVGSDVVKIRVQFGKGYIGACHQLRADVVETRGYRDRVESRTYRANPHTYALCDKHIAWASGDVGPVKKSGRFTYLFCADQESEITGAEHGHAVGQLVNLSDIAKV